MKKKIICILLAAVLAFSVPTRALAFGFAIPLAVEEVVIMLLGLCGITVSDDFDVDEFIADVQNQLDQTGSNLTFASFLSGAAASKVLNTAAVDYAEVFAAVLDVGNSEASAGDTSVVSYYVQSGAWIGSYGGFAHYLYSSWGGAYMFRISSRSFVCAIAPPGETIIDQNSVGNSSFVSQGVLDGYDMAWYRYINSTYANSFTSLPNFASIEEAYAAIYSTLTPSTVVIDEPVINVNATDIDYNSVNDRGVLTGAFSIDMGAIADVFGSIADAWAGVRENVRSWADVVSAGRVIPSIDDKVIEDTASNETVISNTTVADAAASIGDVGDYDLGLENFFPFCLPWDLYNFITLLEATPEAPVIEWEFPVDLDGNTEHYEWSLEDLEYLAEILRTFLTLAFAVGLIFVGGKLFKH